VEREKFDRWLDLAEAQLDAARRVDSAALSAATDARLALQAELVRHPLHTLPEADRAHVAAIARRIRAVDVRIHACGMTVLGVLDTLLPDAGPRTYGRRGQMRGV
jgi:hypothetical protein